MFDFPCCLVNLQKNRAGVARQHGKSNISDTSPFRNMRLSTAQQCIWLALLVIFGMTPCAVFYDWIQNNCRHPFLPFLPLYRIDMQFPWKILFNLSLFFIFGFIHSLLAQTSVSNILKRFFPSQTIRALFMIGTGMSMIFVMSFWQPIEGSVIWSFPYFDMSTNKIMQYIFFYGLLIPTLPILMQFGIWNFFGVKPLFNDDVPRPEGSPSLIKTGFHGFTRHPMYTFTLIAYIITPVVDWNRILIVVASSIYLYFGIIIEEKKLVKLFGKDYIQYQKEVPMIIPSTFQKYNEKNN